MKFTLRQARKIETKIKTYCDSMTVKDGVKVRVQDDLSNIESQLQKGCLSFKDKIDLKSDLISIRFTIRNYISEANHTSGINKLLTEITALKEANAFLSTVAKGTSVKSETAVLKDKVSVLVKRLQKGDGYSDNVMESFDCVDKETKEQLVNKVYKLNKLIEKHSDSVTQLNFTYQITLNEKEYKLLQKCKLL